MPLPRGRVQRDAGDNRADMTAKLLGPANKAYWVTRLLALWKLLRHADTPRAPKIVALLVLAYALSPIDLIPDFIPVLGQLDDIVLVPLGIALAVRLTPSHLWQARLAEAEASADKLPKVWWGVALIALIWLLLLGLLVGWLGGVFVWRNGP
jgi:uncharacterized membrane protein YkvA (DUF1232 family)